MENVKKDNNENVILRMNNISKTFGGTKALQNARLSVMAGEVHALMGENGAGKSTMMKILTGTVKADSGEIELNGKKAAISSAADAIKQGISIVNQELSPQPYMTVAENIFLFREHVFAHTGLLNKKVTNSAAQKILDDFGIDIDARTEMCKLSVAQMQMVEIIRAVVFDAKIIILDEPTSSLTNREVDILFTIIKDLKARGIAIIYISHRMEEIFEICDRVTVYRDGCYVDSKDIAKMNNDDLIYLMAGDIVEFAKAEVEIGAEVLSVKGLCGKGFYDISFDVHAGEIVGFYGLVGSGRSETMRAIFGLDSYDRGEIFLNGSQTSIKNARDAINQGIAMIPEDRKLYGLMLHRSIRENSSLASLYKAQKGMLLDEKRETKEVTERLNKLNLKAESIEATALSLSGGNQQKVVLAKWIMTQPKVLIMDEPTRGIDVAAKAQIHNMMCDFAKQGMAIILISSELPEVMNLSDRMFVYYEGKISGEYSREELVKVELAKKAVLTNAFGK